MQLFSSNSRSSIKEVAVIILPWMKITNNVLRLNLALKPVKVWQKRSKCLKWLMVDLLSRATVFWGHSLFLQRVEKNYFFKNQKLRQCWSFFDTKDGIVYKEFVFQSTTVNASFYQKWLGHLYKKIARVKSEIVHLSSCTKTHQCIPRW